MDTPKRAALRSRSAVVFLDGDHYTLPATLTLDSVPVSDADLAAIANLDGRSSGSEGVSAAVWEALEARGALLGGHAGAQDARQELDGGNSHIVIPDEQLVLRRPFAVVATGRGFELAGHDQASVVTLSALDLRVAAALTKPMVAAAVVERLDGVPVGEVEASLGRLISAGVVAAGDASESQLTRVFRHNMSLQRARRHSVVTWLDEFERREAERAAESGRLRTRVVPVAPEQRPIPALGLVWAYASSFDGGRLNEDYVFVQDWNTVVPTSLTPETEPAVYLFSNYLWSHDKSIDLSARVKEADRRNLTIHGGPNTPKYEADVALYFERYPHVDVAVHGEGEGAFADILDRMAPQFRVGADLDLSVLLDVPGLTVRVGDRIVTTESRPRIAELDSIPSPFEMGLFDSVGDQGIELSVIESNRGCPYGCTFCDWGSATNSRIRKFDLDRVFADIEWCARNKVNALFIADANFGIFSRDVEIAEKIVECRRLYGFPRAVDSSYAKNTVKHLQKIIEIFSEGGVLSTGSLSLQSVDDVTLEAIRRKNIRVDKYNQLAQEFTYNQLPLVVELMMGLPGSTVESLTYDLQDVIDRELRARVNPTEVLVNSPMNDPEYREEHGIVTRYPTEVAWESSESHTRSRNLIVAAASFTRADYERMNRIRQVFLVMENRGVGRHFSRHVFQETGIREMELYVRMFDAAQERPATYGFLEETLASVYHHLIPPGSWQRYIDAVGEFLVSELGVADDSALQTVLRVQHALLPAQGRDFPVAVELEHDYVAWYGEVLRHKQDRFKEDWSAVVPLLRSFGPARLEVDDPQRLSELGLGMTLETDSEGDWELGSPVSRAMRFRHLVHTGELDAPETRSAAASPRPALVGEGAAPSA